MKRRLAVGVFAAAIGLGGLGGCGKTAPAAGEAVETEGTAAPDADARPDGGDLAAVVPEPPGLVAEAVADDVPTFSAAEWGVLVYDKDGVGELASGPVADVEVVPPVTPVKPRPEPPHLEPVLVKKPVIYLRTDASWDMATDITVSVTMNGGGRLHEVWPTVAGGVQPTHGASHTWKVDAMTRGACEAGWAPRVDDPPCSSLARPEACEAAEFETWVAKSELCLDVGGISAPALLYNGFPGNSGAPMAPVVGKAGTFANVSPHAVGLVFLRDTANPDVVTVVNGLAAGATVELGAGAADGVDVAKLVSEELKRQGLSPTEASDFMRAWTPLLSDARGWAVFGFFEPQGIEAISSLDFSPKPASVQRVMAFAVEP